MRGEPALSCIWDTCFSPVLASNQLATDREHLPFPFRPFGPQDRAQEQGPHILLEGATSTSLLLALMAFVGMRTPPPSASSELALWLPAVDPNWLNLPSSEDLWVFPRSVPRRKATLQIGVAVAQPGPWQAAGTRGEV